MISQDITPKGEWKTITIDDSNQTGIDGTNIDIRQILDHFNITLAIGTNLITTTTITI